MAQVTTFNSRENINLFEPICQDRSLNILFSGTERTQGYLQYIGFDIGSSTESLSTGVV